MMNLARDKESGAGSGVCDLSSLSVLGGGGGSFKET